VNGYRIPNLTLPDEPVYTISACEVSVSWTSWKSTGADPTPACAHRESWRIFTWDWYFSPWEIGNHPWADEGGAGHDRTA